MPGAVSLPFRFLCGSTFSDPFPPIYYCRYFIYPLPSHLPPQPPSPPAQAHRRASSRHFRDARVYGYTTTVMHDDEYTHSLSHVRRFFEKKQPTKDLGYRIVENGQPMTQIVPISNKRRGQIRGVDHACQPTSGTAERVLLRVPPKS